MTSVFSGVNVVHMAGQQKTLGRLHQERTVNALGASEGDVSALKELSSIDHSSQHGLLG